MPNRHSLTLTVEEAAALIGVSRSTAYDLAAAGELRTVRLRRRIVVPAPSLADLLGVSLVDVYAATTRLRRGPDVAAAGRDADPSSAAVTQVEHNTGSAITTESDSAKALW